MRTVRQVRGEDGEEQRWLFTSKRGEVQRKKQAAPDAVRERFIRLGLATSDNPERYVCVARRADGGFRYLGEQAFDKTGGALSGGGAGTNTVKLHGADRGDAAGREVDIPRATDSQRRPADPEIVALQCFVPGGYYRNAYERVGAEGRVKTATVVVPTTVDHPSGIETCPSVLAFALQQDVPIGPWLFAMSFKRTCPSVLAPCPSRGRRDVFQRCKNYPKPLSSLRVWLL